MTHVRPAIKDGVTDRLLTAGEVVDPFLGGGMIPPSAGVDDHLPMDDSPGEPTPEEQERGEDTPA